MFRGCSAASAAAPSAGARGESPPPGARWLGMGAKAKRDAVGGREDGAILLSHIEQCVEFYLLMLQTSRGTLSSDVDLFLLKGVGRGKCFLIPLCGAIGEEEVLLFDFLQVWQVHVSTFCLKSFTSKEG